MQAGEQDGDRRRAARPPAPRRGAHRGRSPRAVAQIAALPDPVGEVIEGRRLPNGLDAAQGAGAARRGRRRLRGAAERDDRRRRAVPEVGQRDRAARLVARPRTPTRCSPQIAAAAAVGAGLPEGCVSLVAGGGREELAELATQSEHRRPDHPARGEGLKAALQEVATVPVIYAASGNCHVYVDAARRPRAGARDRAQREDPAPGRVQRGRDPAGARAAGRRSSCPTCSSASATRGCWCAPTRDAVDSRQATLGVAERAGRGAASSPPPRRTGPPSTSRRHSPSAIVESLDEAIEHIARHGSGHSEAIVTARRRPRARLPASASTPPACTSTPPRASPTAASSGWARRSATPPRSSTPAGRSGCASCAPSSTSSKATGTSALERGRRRLGPGVASASSAGRSTRRTSGTSQLARHALRAARPGSGCC